MKPIELDYRKDPELFNETAKSWADAICQDNQKKNGDCGVKSTQIRNFYEKVLELNRKVENREKDFEDILPFVKMLNSKVEYALHRKGDGGTLVNKSFADMMKRCISQVDSPEKLRNFKLFFEAVLGFYKGK
ncbi:CRISPR-associated protein, Csm2 family [Hydrogenimonas sp.]|nr:CRISPR-associated protein, Csm2 family [Hydrogenimonas sp.]